MADVRVQRAEQESSKISKRELYALVCYYYPKYSLKDAQDLPARDLNLLLKTAKKQHALKMKDLIMAIASPHAKDKNSVKNLLSHFDKQIKEL